MESGYENENENGNGNAKGDSHVSSFRCQTTGPASSRHLFGFLPIGLFSTKVLDGLCDPFFFLSIQFLLWRLCFAFWRFMFRISCPRVPMSPGFSFSCES